MTSRSDLFNRLSTPDEKKQETESNRKPDGTGLHEEVESLYQRDAVAGMRFDLEAPHGSAWHTSFHSSSFPGTDEQACGRKALYRMLAFPPDSPIETAVMAAGEAGSDIERRIVDRWHRSGILLSAPPSAISQTVLSDPDTWLTCALDAILNRSPDFKFVHPVDVKSVNHAEIAKIASGEKLPKRKYILQNMIQTWFCRMYHQEIVPNGSDLQPAIGGSLYYVSRQMPRHAVEVWIPWDEEAKNEIHKGLDILKDWQMEWDAEHLPERNPEWKWTMEPCRSCAFKNKICRPDVFDGIENLYESHGIKVSEEIYEKYDYTKMRSEVYKRWEEMNDE